MNFNPNLVIFKKLLGKVKDYKSYYDKLLNNIINKNLYIMYSSD